MTLFLSTFVNKIDKKGRISVPASFRVSLAKQSFNGIVAFRSYKFPAIEAMGSDRMQQLSSSVDNLDLFSDDQDDLTATIFADSHMLGFDGEGRIMLPEPLIAHASLNEAAAFVGRGATFQIWNPDDFEVHQQEARRRVQERQMTVKLQKEQGES